LVEAGVHAAAVVGERRRLAVEELAGRLDLAAKDVDNALSGRVRRGGDEKGKRVGVRGGCEGWV
jgi:hypothetical protein